MKNYRVAQEWQITANDILAPDDGVFTDHSTIEALGLGMFY